MRKAINSFKSCESGATAIEYGLIAALIAVAIIAAVSLLGIEVSNTFSDMAKGLKKRPAVT